MRPATIAGMTANNGENHLSCLTSIFFSNEIVIAYVASSNGIMIAIGNGASGGMPVSRLESMGVIKPTAPAHVQGKKNAATITGKCMGKNIFPPSGTAWSVIGSMMPAAIMTADIIMCRVLLFSIIFSPHSMNFHRVAMIMYIIVVYI